VFEYGLFSVSTVSEAKAAMVTKTAADRVNKGDPYQHDKTKAAKIAMIGLMEKKEKDVHALRKQLNEEEEALQKMGVEVESYDTILKAGETCRKLQHMLALRYCIDKNIRTVKFDAHQQSILDHFSSLLRVKVSHVTICRVSYPVYFSPYS